MLQVRATGIEDEEEEDDDDDEGMLCIIKLRLLPSTSFPIHHSYPTIRRYTASTSDRFIT
jgi:hypothetical protein